jgi:hypothetical protein
MEVPDMYWYPASFDPDAERTLCPGEQTVGFVRPSTVGPRLVDV